MLLIFYPGGNLVPVVRVAVTHFLTLLGLYQRVTDVVIYAIELVNQFFNTRGNLGYNTRVAPSAPPGALPLETIGESWFRVTNFILCVNLKLWAFHRSTSLFIYLLYYCFSNQI